jgi:lysine 2,3-aminomutase
MTSWKAYVSDPSKRVALEKVADRYAVSITPIMGSCINSSDPQDPIHRQFIPQSEELIVHPDELQDPIGDQNHSPLPGLVHRYPDRVLLTLTHTCPVYCRFCFRREVVGPSSHHGLSPLTDDQIETACSYIEQDSKIWEVIFTGGDPLGLSSQRLRSVVERIGQINHLKILRWHTRVPVVAPSLISPQKIAALKASLKTPYVVIHSNHAQEWTPDSVQACAQLADAGIPLLAQSVLLRGVNDTPDALEALMRTLVVNRVKPYYLHHGDLAPGTKHFRTSLAHGQNLMKSLRGSVSGLCQPTYILDIPGGHGKSPIGPDYLSTGSKGIEVEDFRGKKHPYTQSYDEER